MLLKLLAKGPRFRGRDRLSSAITHSLRPRPIAIDNGLRMFLDPSEWAQQEIILSGSTEPRTTRLIQQLLGAGDVFVDVGAHVGHHALVAGKSVGKNGKVIAIDPQPFNADRIGQNALVNDMPQIEVINAAMSDASGFASFAFQKCSDRSRFDIAGGSPNDTPVKFECPIRRLDEVLADRGLDEIALLKIDVEGFERQVLEGLGEWLPECRNIIFEQLPDSDDSAMALLRSAGFILSDVEGNAITRPGAVLERNIWAQRQH